MKNESLNKGWGFVFMCWSKDSKTWKYAIDEEGWD